MVHLFQPKLLNGHSGDPVVLVSLFGKSNIYLIDIGDISKLSNKDVLKINKIFVSHTHMDHFYGFDRVLRTFLGKEKYLQVFGPKNIIKNIKGKLEGYTWNLVDNYKTNFTIEVFEILATKINRAKFQCKKKFKLEKLASVKRRNNIIVRESNHQVRAIILNHKTPSISYILEEDFHINILKEKLNKLGLSTGKWLSDLKEYIYQGKLNKNLTVEDKIFNVGFLKKKICKITIGYKITYITDIIFSKENIKKLKPFIKNTTFLFIEASFLNRERARARERFHLTAKQAGYIAKLADAKKNILFHISPIHHGEYALIKKEFSEIREE